MSNKIQVIQDKAGNNVFPITHEKAVRDSSGVSLEAKLSALESKTYIEAWDGASTPVVANIPAGVIVSYDGTNYTGTLAASSSTDGKIYLVKDGTEYNRYASTINLGGTYIWSYLGTTAMSLSGYATEEELSQLDQEMEDYVIEKDPGSTNIMDIYTDPSFNIVINSSGVETANTTYNTTTYLPVKASTDYISSVAGYVTYYDAEKNRVGSRKELTSSSKTFTTHSSAAFIRFSCKRASDWRTGHINEGSTLETKDDFRPASEYNRITRNTDHINGLEVLLYRPGLEPVTDFVSGAYIKTSSYPGDVADVNNPVSSAGYKYAIIPVLEGEKFVITGTGGAAGRLWAFTDSSYVIYMQRGADATDTDVELTIPVNGYLIVNFVTSVPNSLARKFTELAVDVAQESDFDRGPFLPFKHQFAERYYGLQESYPAGSELGQNTTYAEAIALMDSLVAAGSGYVVKTAVGTGAGTDAGGNQYTLYDYAFIPPTAPNSNVKGKRPVVMIDACQHGFEKTAFYGWYFFFKDLIENWDKNPALEAIRCGVEIHFIPVVNAWGFDQDVRNNYNGVNLNRNFDVPNWEASTESSEASGAAPFDQPETQVIRDWLDLHPDACLLIDTHTNGHYNASGWTEANHNLLVSGISDEYYNRMYDSVRRLIESQTVVFAKEYGFVIPTRFGQFHTTEVTTTKGMIHVYGAAERKMLATTLEGFNGLMVNDVDTVHIYGANSKKVNSEIFGNFLLQMLQQFMQ